MNTVQKWRRAPQGRPSNLTVGLEPTTPGLQDRRSIQLSYERSSSCKIAKYSQFVKGKS